MKKGIRTSGILLILVLLLTQCSDWGRTPSRERFSKACNIEIPENIDVIKDEYHNMWQDYAIIYEIKIPQESVASFTQGIRNSKFYNSDVFDNVIREDSFIEIGESKAVWIKTENGYRFLGERNRNSYSANIDTITGIAIFNEYSD